MSHPIVLEVVPGSPAAAAGIDVGDELVAIDGVSPTDVIEYQELVDDADPTFTVLRSGIEIEVPIPKPEGHPVGLRLNASIFDRVQTCDNHCEFCFIYQLPPGMRQSLYLKDDDYRLSFLYGNFTTLTRFTELDVARVVEERLEPLYVSIHATDPGVRADMLRNPRGATSLRWLRALLEHGTTVHGQIVLCPGINNGPVLEQTCAEILTRYAGLATVGIVPLGLSRFNTEQRLTVHTPEEARSDLEIIHFWRDRAEHRLGRRMFFASDELYLRAGLGVPDSAAYEGFVQHENGIGMIRAFYDELDRLEQGTNGDAPLVSGEWRTIPAAPDEGYRAVRHLEVDMPRPARGPVVVITGEYGAAALDPIRLRLERIAGTGLRLLPVKNEFFGGNTAVSGLLVGADVRRALERDSQPAGLYLLPDVALSGDVFLDDLPLHEVAKVAKAPLRVAEANARGLLEAAAA